jgi:hypothetical protein
MHDLMTQLARDNAPQVEAGNICGEWHLYSSDYLNLRNYDSRLLQISGKPHFEFHNYQHAGTLVISREQTTSLVDFCRGVETAHMQEELKD